MGVFARTLLPLLLFLRLWLFPVRFDTRRRRRLLLFPFLDADQSQAQLFPHLAPLSQGVVEGFLQHLMFCSKVTDCIRVCHGLRVSERSRVNSIKRATFEQCADEHTEPDLDLSEPGTLCGRRMEHHGMIALAYKCCSRRH